MRNLGECKKDNLNFIGLKNGYPEPLVLQSSELIEAQRLVTIYSRALSPASANIIAVCVQKLFLHYPVKDMKESENEMLMQDWLEDLSEYPNWAINDACVHYRKNNKWRPTVSDIIKICDSLVFSVKWEKRRLEKGMK